MRTALTGSRNIPALKAFKATNKENRHRTRKALWHGAYFLISLSIL